MSLAGRGMLLTAMDVAIADEADLNRWYDREHLAERVAIEGFLEARRYVAVTATPKYLSLYSTATFDMLDSPAYRTALANQTAWSKANIARFQNMQRAVARIGISRGHGRGAVLGLIRVRPAGKDRDELRATMTMHCDQHLRDGIISMHLAESDPALSRPLTDDPDALNPAAGDWYLMIDGTDIGAVSAVTTEITGTFAMAIVISSGTYRLLWDLAKDDCR